MKFCRNPNVFLLLVISSLFILSACDSSPIEELAISPDYVREPGEHIPETELKLRQSTVSDILYDLNLDLTQQNRYAGTVDIRFSYQVTDYPLTIDFAGGEVERIWLNNNSIGIDYNGQFISIPANLLRDGKNRIKVQFSRTFSHDTPGLNRYFDNHDQSVYLYLNNALQSIHTFFPLFDQPDLPFTINAIYTTDKDWTLYSSIPTSKVHSRGDYQLWYLSGNDFLAHDISLVTGDWHEWQGRSANKQVKVLVRRSIQDIIPIRGWYQRIQSSTPPLADYFGLDVSNQALIIALLPGLYDYHNATTSLLGISERPLLLESDLNPDWNRLLTRHYVSLAMSMKDLSDQWLKPWLVAKVTKQLFSESQLPVYDGMFANRVQPGQQLITNNYPDNFNVLNNWSLTNVKGLSLLNGLDHISQTESLATAVQRFLTTENNTFSDLLDDIATTDSLKAHTWASQMLGSPGVNTLTTERTCAQGMLKELAVRQLSMPQYPQIHHIPLTLEYLEGDTLSRQTGTLTSDRYIFKRFPDLSCDAVLMLDAGSAILITNDNASEQLRELSQAMAEVSILEVFQNARLSKESISESELTQWLHLTRARLEQLSAMETSQLINLILSEHRRYPATSDELKKALLRLSNRLFQLSLNSSANPDKRINWFKLHLHTLTEANQADHLFNWFIGKSEPQDLNTIETLKLAVLDTMSTLSHEHTGLLNDQFRERASHYFRSDLQTLEMVRSVDFDAASYLEQMLDNPHLHTSDYGMALFHPYFFMHINQSDVLNYARSEIDRLEKRLGARLLQVWLEPELLRSCEKSDLINSFYQAATIESLNMTTRIWLAELALSCQLDNQTHQN